MCDDVWYGCHVVLLCSDCHWWNPSACYCRNLFHFCICSFSSLSDLSSPLLYVYLLILFAGLGMEASMDVGLTPSRSRISISVLKPSWLPVETGFKPQPCSSLSRAVSSDWTCAWRTQAGVLSVSAAVIPAHRVPLRSPKQHSASAEGFASFEHVSSLV